MTSKFGLGDLAAAGLANVGVGPLNVGNVLDTVEFVKKAWSTFGVPSSLAPTADLDELDRRISDLKAVEQWLTVNMSMLQGTIQALEIQRGTIATLKAYGGAFGAPAAGAQAIANLLSAAAMPQMPTGESTRPEGGAAANDAATESSSPTAAAPPGAAPASTQAARPETGRPSAVEPDESRREQRGSGRADAATSGGASGGAAAAMLQPGLDPAAWWNLLQSQFNQVATAAMTGVGLPSPGSAGARDDEPDKGARGRAPHRAGASDEGAPLARSRSRKSADAFDAASRGEKDGAKPRALVRGKAKRPKT